MNPLELIIAALGLVPAEGATEVTPEEVLAKIEELKTGSSTAADSATALATATTELEQIRAQYQELYNREEEARKRQAEAQADEVLAQYEGRIATPEAKARLRALLLSDNEMAVEILNGLPAAPVAPVVAEPPTPQHDPAKDATSGPDEKAIADAIAAEVKKIQAQNPKIAFATAWSKAEAIVRKKVAANEPLT